MGNFKSKPLKEVMRENKRVITRAIRELDREKTGLEREEKRLTMEIKKAARENQMNSVKIMAKVRWIIEYEIERFFLGATLSFFPLAHSCCLRACVTVIFLLYRIWYGRGSILPSLLKWEATYRA